jgi:4-hydroxy-L-threonine phosphate dehydrogenase PdxA
MPAKPVVAITMGDPAGIGSEVMVAAHRRVADETSLVEAVEVAVRMAGERSDLSRRRAGRSAMRERDDLDRR